jgi:hypothetical protein
LFITRVSHRYEAGIVAVSCRYQSKRAREETSRDGATTETTNEVRTERTRAETTNEVGTNGATTAATETSKLWGGEGKTRGVGSDQCEEVVSEG